MKVCSECKQEKPLEEFHKRGKKGRQHNCKACACTVRKRYWKPHTSIRLKLGLTQEEIDNLTRPGACECCGSKERLCIDHCHDTKKPRGLLCHKCNTALGLLDDDSQKMIKLIQYLERSKPLQ
jgi:hypothetical protein